MYIVFFFLQVTSPGDNTVHTSKGTSGDKFEFKAPRSGMYKFCFHNPYSTPETVSFNIHVGHIPNEHNIAKDGLWNSVSILFSLCSFISILELAFQSNFCLDGKKKKKTKVFALDYKLLLETIVTSTINCLLNCDSPSNVFETDFSIISLFIFDFLQNI